MPPIARDERPAARPASHSAKFAQAAMRQRNTHLLLQLIQVHSPVSQADLARLSGLSPATVSNILQPFMESGLLTEEGKSTGGLGRRASLMSFNPHTAFVVGVTVDREACEVALVDLAAHVVQMAVQPHPQMPPPRDEAANIHALLEQLLQESGLARQAVIGVGIAMPGLIDMEAGVVKTATNLGWHNVPFRRIVQEALGLPVHLEHLGKAKVTAEALCGAAAGHHNVVCIEIGSGVGAGVILDGRLPRGATASPAEVGHNVLDPDGPPCACGLRGCWEMFCSGPAIRQRYVRALETASPAHGEAASTAAVSLRALEQAARTGDALARQVLAETADYMVRGLMNVIWNFDPELIVLSGFVVQECPSLVEATRAALRQLRVARTVDVPLVATEQGPLAGVVAASAPLATRYLEALSKQHS